MSNSVVIIRSPRRSVVERNLRVLVKRAQQGDTDAQGALYERYRPVVLRVATSRLGDPSAAEDLTQEVFIHAFDRLSQLREPSAFGGWLRQITCRLAINVRTRARPVSSLKDEMMEAIPSRVSGPLEACVEAERREQVRLEIERLDASDRVTIKAHYFENQSIEEMAERFDAPAGTIRRRLHVARKRLARRIGSPQAV